MEINILAAALEKIASLDTLAAMILMCQAAHIAAQTDTACEWVWHIYRSLVMHGKFLLDRGIARPLFELIEQRLFQVISHQGWRYYFPKDLYVETASALFNILWHLEGIPYMSMSEKQKRSYMQRILDGDFGWDLKFAFNPFKKALSNGTAMYEDDLDSCQKDLHLFVWAWNMHRSHQNHPHLPPIAFLKGVDLWAMQPD